MSPKGMYINSKQTSAGLTAAIERNVYGEPFIQAGALVQADRGICAIDEFDKMSKYYTFSHLILIDFISIFYNFTHFRDFFIYFFFELRKLQYFSI